MAYRNKTFVSFASEDINYYWLMTAWKANEHIDFDFYDAHDLNTARDTSLPQTIRTKLRERLANAKQVVMLIGEGTRAKAARSDSFVHYEADVIAKLDIPVVLANLNQSRTVRTGWLPDAIYSNFTVSVSFQPAIIKQALDWFPAQFEENRGRVPPRSGPHQYPPSVYSQLGL